MNHKEIIDVANKLTNENIEQLIHIFADRIFVFIGSNNKMQFSGKLSKENPVCLNGAGIQINMEYTEKKDSFVKEYKEYLK